MRYQRLKRNTEKGVRGGGCYMMNTHTHTFTPLQRFISSLAIPFIGKCYSQ